MKVNDLKSHTHSQVNSVDVDLGQYAHIIRIDIILHYKETIKHYTTVHKNSAHLVYMAIYNFV